MCSRGEKAQRQENVKLTTRGAFPDDMVDLDGSNSQTQLTAPIRDCILMLVKSKSCRAVRTHSEPRATPHARAGPRHMRQTYIRNCNCGPWVGRWSRERRGPRSTLNVRDQTRLWWETIRRTC